MLQNVEKNTLIEERKKPKNSNTMELNQLFSIFGMEDENSMPENYVEEVESTAAEHLEPDLINGRVRKEGQSEIEYILQSYEIIQNEEGKVFFWNWGNEKIKWSRIPFHSATNHDYFVDKKHRRWKCFYKLWSE